jgi:pimeloyl-[acyl-carrier protein] methyl ester esterase
MGARPAAPTLVLLPGLDGTGDFFQPLLESLGDSVRSRVVRYPVDSAFDHATCEALVRAALPTDGPYVLLGESFSGPIAISLAAEAPKGLVGIILCATFASNPRPRLAFIRPLLPYIPYHGTKSSLPLSRFLVLGRWITPAIRELHLTILSKVPPATMRARIEAVADCDVREALGRIRAPILCLVPRHDRLIPRSAARVIQQRAPASRVVELDAPHCLLQCVPGMAAEQIREFLQGLG